MKPMLSPQQAIVDQLLQPLLQFWVTADLAALAAAPTELVRFAFSLSDSGAGPHQAILQALKTFLVVAKSYKARVGSAMSDSLSFAGSYLLTCSDFPFTSLAHLSCLCTRRLPWEVPISSPSGRSSCRRLFSLWCLPSGSRRQRVWPRCLGTQSPNGPSQCPRRTFWR